MEAMYRLLIHRANQIVCISNTRQRVLKNSQMNDIVVLDKQNDEGLSIIIGK